MRSYYIASMGYTINGRLKKIIYQTDLNSYIRNNFCRDIYRTANLRIYANAPFEKF